MKSIYSIKILQRILDHWGIGPIKDVTYFDSVGRNIWRHYIDTNQGEFELYLSNGMSLHFGRADKFPAIEVHLKSRKNDLLIFEEKELFYTRDFRDK